VRTEGEPAGLPFERSAEVLARVAILNLTTRHGDLDLAYEPAGTHGYTDLRRAAVETSIDGTTVTVAALEDVIRSKRAAARDRDPLVPPTLERLLERLERRE